MSDSLTTSTTTNEIDMDPLPSRWEKWRSISIGLRLLAPTELRGLVAFSGIIAISKLLEMGSLISVMPVVSLIIEPSLLEQGGAFTTLHDLAGNPPAADLILWLAFGSCALILVGNISEFLVTRYIFLYCAKRESRLARELMNQIATAPYEWLIHQHSVMLNRAFQIELGAWGGRYLRNVLMILNHVLTIVIGVALILHLAPATGAVSVVIFGSVVAGIIYFVRPRILHWGREVKRFQDASTLAGNSLLSGNRDFKFSADNRFMISRFAGVYDDWTMAVFKALFWGSVSPRLLLAIGQISILGLAVFLWLSDFSSAEISSQMAVLLLLVSRLLPAANQLNGAFNSFWGSRPWIENIISIQSAAIQAKRHRAPDNDTCPAPTDWRSIRLENVSYQYDVERGMVVQGISIELPFGKHFGVVGPSGSGKSTLIDLLTGLLKPTGGEIYIGETPLNDVSEESWRMQIGYVSQRSFFADESIRSCVAYGIPASDIDEARVRRCLEMAHLAEVVENLPLGMATTVGEQASRLSGGQRQRLAIARALYKQPRLLILDEATNGLDPASEAGVLEAIDGLNGQVTVLNISHQASATRSCVQIFEINDGKLTDPQKNVQ